MNNKKDGPRILAIDLRVKRFGYAVFEGPKRLLDWGGSACPTGNVAGRRVADLLKLFYPAVVVIRKERRTGVRSGSGATESMKAIGHEAAIRSVAVCLVTPEEIKEAFRIFPARTKDEIASMLAGIFPEILWSLPRRRKAWETEPHVMIVFDAVAAGFTYWQRDGTQVTPPE